MSNILDVLDDAFYKHVEKVNSLQTKPDNNILLQLYSYYKQATSGDNNIVPSFLDFKAKSKWNAWNNVKGMKKETAQVKYIKLVEKLIQRK